MADAGRPKVNVRKTVVGIRDGIDGWLAFMTLEHGSMSAYINGVIEADRRQTIEADGDLAERYKLFLMATNRDAETLVVESMDPTIIQ